MRRLHPTVLLCLAFGALISTACDHNDTRALRSERDATDATDTAATPDLDVSPTDSDLADSSNSDDPNSNADIDTDIGTEADAERSGLLVVENPANALSAFVSWNTESPTTTRLVVRCGENFSQLYESTNFSAEHEVFIMGLWAGAVCSFSADGEYASGGFAPALTASLEVAELPSDLPTLSVDAAADLDQMQPGWTLFNVSKASSPASLMGVIVDELGRVRWYHQYAFGRTGNANALSVVDGGVLFGGGADLPTSLVRWDGQTMWTTPFNTHHEAGYLGDPWNVYLLRYPEPCPDGLVPPVAPVIAWDPIADVERWRWLICDQYSPSVASLDWAHLNGVDMVPEGDALIVSSRHQSALFRVDVDSGHIDWVLGYGGRPEDGWAGDFAMVESDRFLEQHAPEVLPNGNILIFDNGSCASCSEEAQPIYRRDWSRAVEIAYDTSTWEAEVVWEFRPQPDIYSAVMGDADRLPSGNTLVTFGVDRYGGRPRIIEVSPDGEVVWDLSLQAHRSTYRADRIEPTYGFVY